MSIAILGAGAFGTSLAIAISANGPVTLWARDAHIAEMLQTTRTNDARLPGVQLPHNIDVTADLAEACQADVLLLALPTQQLGPFLTKNADKFANKSLIACCKGIDLTTLRGPTGIIQAAVPSAVPAILTGPSFAADIARGLPTALTLACEVTDISKELQRQLSTQTLRLYRSSDVIGAELGGALKNVIAIACGVCIGAGLGDSARAALLTRGFAEMQRLALDLKAGPDTLSGLSGFGDLTLTCTSDLSRNYRYGLALGRGEQFGAGTTVEGVTTAKAVVDLAQKRHLDLPICATVYALTIGELTPQNAMAQLLSRPLKEE